MRKNNNEQKEYIQMLCDAIQKAGEHIAEEIRHSRSDSRQDRPLQMGFGSSDSYFSDSVGMLEQIDGVPDPDWCPDVPEGIRSELEEKPYSKEGLRERLHEIAGMYEYNWSDEDINEALENCQVDWKHEAVRALMDEISGKCRFSFNSEFSYPALGRKLEKEYFFTMQESRFALDNAGIDWMDQAVKCALKRLSFSMETDEELESTLIFSGFSAREAEAAIKAMKELPEYRSIAEERDSAIRREICEEIDLHHQSRSRMIESRQWRLPEPLSERDKAEIENYARILDSMNINWRREAQLNAEKELRKRKRSRSELIVYLVNEEGFTIDEAEYAADNPYEYSRSWTSDF